MDHKTAEIPKAEFKSPIGSLDFAVKTKSIIVRVYSHGTEEPAQKVGALYNTQLNIFKEQTASLQSTIDRYEKALREVVGVTSPHSHHCRIIASNALKPHTVENEK